jgi:hypothetical protein
MVRPEEVTDEITVHIHNGQNLRLEVCDEILSVFRTLAFGRDPRTFRVQEDGSVKLWRDGKHG